MSFGRACMPSCCATRRSSSRRESRERLSENGNFLSIQYRIRAESREQIEALAADLKSCEGVLMLMA